MLKEFFAREGKVCMLVALMPSNEERLCGWYVGGARSKQKQWRQVQNNKEKILYLQNRSIATISLKKTNVLEYRNELI